MERDAGEDEDESEADESEIHSGKCVQRTLSSRPALVIIREVEYFEGSTEAAVSREDN